MPMDTDSSGILLNQYSDYEGAPTTKDTLYTHLFYTSQYLHPCSHQCILNFFEGDGPSSIVMTGGDSGCEHIDSVSEFTCERFLEQVVPIGKRGGGVAVVALLDEKEDCRLFHNSTNSLYEDTFMNCCDTSFRFHS